MYSRPSGSTRKKGPSPKRSLPGSGRTKRVFIDGSNGDFRRRSYADSPPPATRQTRPGGSLDSPAPLDYLLVSSGPGGNSSVVERHLAKVDVAGSTPVSRSKISS